MTAAMNAGANGASIPYEPRRREVGSPLIEKPNEKGRAESYPRREVLQDARQANSNLRNAKSESMTKIE
jgi:hypothetical protein